MSCSLSLLHFMHKTLPHYMLHYHERGFGPPGVRRLPGPFSAALPGVRVIGSIPGDTVSAVRYATEPLRAVLEGGALVAGLPLLRFAPRGEPHPVLVLPGLLASDQSTTVLRGVRGAPWERGTA